MKLNVFLLASVILSMDLLYAQEHEGIGVSICWDTSLSMTDRNLEKDFSILESYFKKTDDVRVQLIFFDLHVEEKKFEVRNGDWTALKNELVNSRYDGATVFSNLKNRIQYPDVFVFTDGKKLLAKDRLPIPEKAFIVNSSADRNTKFLEKNALIHKSRLIDFATEYVKERTNDSQDHKKANSGLLQGTVFIDNKPAANAKVALKGISDSFLTDEKGGFRLPAEVGDTLLVTSRFGKTLKIVPIEIMQHTKIFLESDIVSLDEVVVVEERQELERVNTGYGEYNKDALGFEVATIESNEISAVEMTAGDAVRNKVAGVDVSTKNSVGVEGGLAQTEIRGRNSLYMDSNALIVIDGIPKKRSGTAINVQQGSFGQTIANHSFIDPANIEKITVLKGLAATNQWGSDGANGVILITTKTASGSRDKNKRKEDRARLKNNVYEGKESEFARNTSPFFKAFESATSLEMAYETYMTLREMNRTSIEFYLNAFAYFQAREPKVASKVISNIWEIDPDDNEVLKLLAMALSSTGDYQNALSVNEELVERMPSDVNARFDLTMALKELGQSQKALNELLAMARGDTYFSIDASGIQKTLNREIRNLIFKSEGLNTASVDNRYLNNLKYKVRLVFEWNHPGAEFELQFVNPQKRFFNWKHTNTENRALLEQEIAKGFRIEEFEFTGKGVSGEWIVNAKALNDFSKDKKTPFVLKTTIYKNYGQSTQTMEEVFISLENQNDKRNIAILQVD